MAGPLSTLAPVALKGLFGLFAGKGKSRGLEALSRKANIEGDILEFLKNLFPDFLNEARQQRLDQQERLGKLGKFSLSGLPGLTPEEQAFLAQNISGFNDITSSVPDIRFLENLFRAMSLASGAFNSRAGETFGNIGQQQRNTRLGFISDFVSSDFIDNLLASLFGDNNAAVDPSTFADPIGGGGLFG